MRRFDGDTVTTFRSEDGWPDEGVFTIHQDRDDNLWFGTENGVIRFDGAFVTFTTEDGLAGGWIWVIVEDREGALWFGNWFGDGLSRFDGQTFTTFSPADGLGGGWSHQVAGGAADRKGNLWFGGHGGLTRYDGERLESVPLDRVDRASVLSILEDEGGLWIGRGTGVIRLSGGSSTTLSADDGLGHPVVRSLFKDAQGHLWIGSNGGGVSRYDGKTIQTLTAEDGLGGNTVLSIAQDQDGDMWFATNNGVTRFTPPPAFPPSWRWSPTTATRASRN